MNRRVCRHRPLTRVEIQRRYRARRRESRMAAQENPRPFVPLSGPVTHAERIAWAQHDAEEAKKRMLSHRGERAYEVAYESRRRELEALQAMEVA